MYVPRRDIEKFQEIYVSENHGTHLIRFIRDETRGMDLHLGITISANSSALQVACFPPGHRGKFRKFLQTITHPLTSEALLISKVLSWISTSASYA
jgi:hypothetical protein